MKNILAILVIIAVVVGAVAVLQGKINAPSSNIISDNKMQKFSSQQELEDYLKSGSSYGNYGPFYRNSGGIMALEAAKSADSGQVAPAAGSDYSQTNVQVEGVDEADIVKNDGKYIYIAHSDKVLILDAYPAQDAKVIAEINPDGYVQNIFVNNNKLVVFGNQREIYYPYPGPIPLAAEGGSGVAVKSADASEQSIGPIADEAVAKIGFARPIYYQPPKSFIQVYDITSRENPKLERNLTTEGGYQNARMIDNYVYAIYYQPTYWLDNYPVPLPVIYEDGVATKIAATSIYYPIVPVPNSQYTNVIALNINNKNDQPNMESFLIGYSSTIYVSEDNIYIAAQKQIDYRFQELKVFEEAVIPNLPQNIQDEISEIKKSDKKDYEKYQEISDTINSYIQDLDQDKRQELESKIEQKRAELEVDYQKELQKTLIHKISIDNKNIDYKAVGEVNGHLLNQFSMDEYNNDLRVATTTEPVYYYQTMLKSATSINVENVEKNHLFVLDNNMKLKGKIEDIAPGERIYSTRFMGKRAYMVTFKQIDPLFVIDLSNPSSPKILGKLKIPGYSDYLHPYDENTIIGIGKEAEDIKEGNQVRALPKGIKLALFDVSDVENPQQIAKYEIGDRGTDSEALYEHKAFLFSKEKNLLVLPITLAEFKNAQESQFQYGEYTFQGAYVFKLTKESGFELKGRISHTDDEELSKLGSYGYFSNPVRRSLYIDDTLYTISDGLVKANRLDNLEIITLLKLPKPKELYPIVYATTGGGIAIE